MLLSCMLMLLSYSVAILLSSYYVLSRNEISESGVVKDSPSQKSRKRNAHLHVALLRRAPEVPIRAVLS